MCHFKNGRVYVFSIKAQERVNWLVAYLIISLGPGPLLLTWINFNPSIDK